MDIIYAEPEGDLATMQVVDQQIILTAEYLHYVQGKPVTVGTIAETLNISTASVYARLNDESIRTALESRGIVAIEQRTPERQLAFLLCMFNPLDLRSHKQIMSDLGISLQEWYGWHKDAQFKELQDRLAADFFSSAGLFVDRELMRQALRGNVNAMRLYYDQKAQQGMSPQVIVQRLVDVVQKYVKDPEVQRSIAQELIGSSKVVKGQVE